MNPIVNGFLQESKVVFPPSVRFQGPTASPKASCLVVTSDLEMRFPLKYVDSLDFIIIYISIVNIVKYIDI